MWGIPKIRDIIENECETRCDLLLISITSIITSILFLSVVGFSIMSIFPMISLYAALYVLFVSRWEERLDKKTNRFLKEMDLHIKNNH